MEEIRVSERNRVNDQVRQLKKYIDIDSTTIDKYALSESSYATNQIWKLTEKNKDRMADLDRLYKKLLDLNAGLLDEELNKNISRNTQEAKRKTGETLKKKSEDQPTITQNKQAQFKPSTRYLERQDAKEVDRAYKYHVKSVDSIPDHIINKLKNMPNNKGYTWKGMYLFGELPPEETTDVTSIFEKIKGDITVITEWSKIDCKVYHKQGKNKKKLVESYKKTLKISGR